MSRFFVIVPVLLSLAAIAAAVLLVVLVSRYLIAATRARVVETTERRLRVDLLIAERGHLVEENRETKKDSTP